MTGRFNPDEYVTVAQRIEKFYAKHPQGRILTSVLEHNAETGFVLMKAEVYREPNDALAAATGHAYELKSAGHVQQGSYIEVCETSAVGRALALLGFEVRRGVASREEMEKAARKQPEGGAPSKPAAPTTAPQKMDRAALLTEIGAVCKELNASGDLPEWDQARINAFAREKFKVPEGTKNLSDAQLGDLITMLRERMKPVF